MMNLARVVRTSDRRYKGSIKDAINKENKLSDPLAKTLKGNQEDKICQNPAPVESASKVETKFPDGIRISLP
jgi:hypothetical protein